MKWPRTVAVASSFLFAQHAFAQTYSKCNPLDQSCAPDPALGGSTTISFTSGASGDFSEISDGISYNSEGAQLTVSGPDDAPTLASKWYLMFGHVDMVFKSAPGVGMVSSAILLSDDLDEIDWELLGADSSQGQTNYFGKGITGSYNRAAFVSTPQSQTAFHTYSIDWTADRILWQIDGATVRTLEASEAGDQYPQTPMQIKIGSWAGGAPTNSEGTIQWAGGPINYSDGPYTMVVKSISATDYSTGSSYQYSGTDGSWQQVKSNGGSVNPSGTPASSGTGSGDPPTHSEVTGTRTSWPWVQSTGSTTLQTGLPTSSSLNYGSGGHRSKQTDKSSPSSASSASSSAAPVAGGCEVISGYNQKGFPTVMTVSAGYKPTYNNQGSLISPAPCVPTATASMVTSVSSIQASQTFHTLPTALSNTSSTPTMPPNPGSMAPHGFVSFSTGALTILVAAFAMLL